MPIADIVGVFSRGSGGQGTLFAVSGMNDGQRIFAELRVTTIGTCPCGRAFEYFDSTGMKSESEGAKRRKVMRR